MSISSWFSSSSSSSPSSSTDSLATTTPQTSNEPVVRASVQTSNSLVSAKNPQGLKPCCACPETKKARDDCFLKYGSNVDEDSESRTACKDIVERHKQCMRDLGFNV